MSTTTPERTTVRREGIPSPRPAPDDTIVPEPTEQPAEQPATEHVLPAPRYPWPEPWGSARGAQPRTEVWDEATQSWHSRGPYPR